MTCNWKEGDAVTEIDDTTECTSTEVLVLLTRWKIKSVHVFEYKPKPTYIDSVDLALNLDYSIFASKYIDGLADFCFLDGDGFILVKFLQRSQSCPLA